MPLSLGDAVDLLDRSIQKIWAQPSEAETRMFEQYAGVETGVEDYYLKESAIGGLGYASRILDNAVVTEQKPVQGFDKTFTQVQYGVLMSFTKPMWYFGIKKRDLTQLTDEGKRACSDLRERLFAERLENSFASSYTTSDDTGNYSVTTTGGDGNPLIYESHTREDSGTVNNNRVTDGTTVNMDFDYEGLKAAHRTAALIRNPKGKPMNISLDTLIVKKGSTNHFKAQEILKAIQKDKIPESADNDGAGVGAFKIVALPWILTNTAYWWMIDSKLKDSVYGSLQYKESQAILPEGPNVVFKTGEIQYKATTMFDIGHRDYRNLVGSKNTNAT
jgi:hypothetical protein